MLARRHHIGHNFKLPVLFFLQTDQDNHSRLELHIPSGFTAHQFGVGTRNYVYGKNNNLNLSEQLILQNNLLHTRRTKVGILTTQCKPVVQERQNWIQ